VAGFAFDARVAAVFDDMIRRSVPGYGLTLSMLSQLAARYAQPGSTLFDLGCSLGAGIAALQQGLSAEECRIVGIDNSEAMLAECRQRLAALPAGAPVELLCADVRNGEIADASLVALNFTLQFVPIEDRLPLLTRIHAGLRPGGILVLSEKIAFADAAEEAFQRELHHDFKRAQGYSDLEVSQKRQSLENVLLPETVEAHRQRLQLAGFDAVYLWFQCFNFVSLVAIKR